MPERIYFDYAASTPVDPRVERAMRPYFLTKFGNPGSLHAYGQEAIAAIDQAREEIAREIGAEFRELIFTGSATEANNLVLCGVIAGFRLKVSGVRKPRIIVSAIEHESVLETVRELRREGVEVVELPVDCEGVVDLKRLSAVLNERTALVSVMYANNEVGTIEPIAEIAEIIREFRLSLSPHSHISYPLFHTDAAQAFQFLSCNVHELGVDLMTLSAHKIYGPKGVGALYVRTLKPTTYNLKPIITGGGQEFGLRSGTENVPLIVGFGKAVELAARLRVRESKRLRALTEYFFRSLKTIVPAIELNGAEDPTRSLPHILNVYFPRHLAADLLVKLDLEGIALSSGSACGSRSPEPSYVIETLSGSRERAEKSIRFSFGRPTRRSTVDGALTIIRKLFRS